MNAASAGRRPGPTTVPAAPIESELVAEPLQRQDVWDDEGGESGSREAHHLVADDQGSRTPTHEALIEDEDTSCPDGP